MLGLASARVTNQNHARDKVQSEAVRGVRHGVTSMERLDAGVPA
jgi:hypothetical protein